MKIRSLLLVALLAISVDMFGQQSQKPQSNSASQQQVEQLQEQFNVIQQNLNEVQRQLKESQKVNEKLKEDLEREFRKVDDYRNALQHTEDKINDNLGHWLVLLTIIMGLIGVVAPIFINIRMEKKLEDDKKELKLKLNDVYKIAEQAVKDALDAKNSLSKITQLKNEIDGIKKTIAEDKAKAEEAANNAEISKMFAEALSEKDPQKAIDKYTEIIRIDPKCSEAYYNRGFLKAAMGYKDDAWRDYDKAIEINPNYSNAYLSRGTLKRNSGDKKGAMLDYDKAIELNPNNSNAYSNRGFLKKQNGDIEGAMRDCDKAIETDSSNSMAYLIRGTLKQQEGAMRDYDKAIELNPNFSIAYCLRVNLWMDKGELQKALDDVNKALSIEPDDAYCLDARGKIYLKMKRFEDSLNDLNRAINNDNEMIAAYEHRTQCYEALAAIESDKTKKAEYLAKAEADRKKAEELK